MSVTFGADPRPLRIFISSPGDVETERNVARRVIALLDGRWGEHVRLGAYDYREESFHSLDGFQEQVPDVSHYDLVIGILWKRIGTRLNPEKFSPEAGFHASGTVYELENAFMAAERQGRPDVVVFRKQAKVQFDEGAVAQQMDQREKLLRWWQSCFGAPGEPVKRASISFEGPDDFEDTLERWLEDWLRKSQLIPSGPSWNISRDGSPYPGLVAYDARHGRVFKGRDSSIKRALALLRRRTARGAWSLFIVGPSGSGKSSFVRAGLAPRLLTAGGIEGVGVWRQVLLEPSDDPIAMLARRLFTNGDVSPAALPELAAGPDASAESWAKLARLSPENAAGSVVWALNQVARRQSERVGNSRSLPARLLIILDQLESFGVIDGFDTLIILLAELVGQGGALVLATLRSDSYAVLQSSSTLSGLRGDDGVFDLPTPGQQELREIIEAPAADAGLGWDVEGGRALNDLLALQVYSADALPLLQMTLHELFERRDAAANILTFAGYREIGGIEGAIATRADRTLQALSPSARDQLDPLLRELVADVDMAGRLAMRTVARTWYEPDPARLELINAFVNARLLVEDVDHVRIAHEALLRHWPRARQSPALQTEALRIGRVLAPLAATWSTTHSDEDLVVAPALLAAAGEIVRGHPGALDPRVEAFARAAEQALAAKREAVLREGRSRELAAYARAELEVDQTKALELALEANDEAQTSEAAIVLRQALHGARCRAIFDTGAPFTDLAFAPDRPLLASGHRDGSIQLWETASLRWLRTIRDPAGRGARLEFDPTGKYLAVSHAGRVTIYDASSWSELNAFDCFNGVVSLAFNSDGSRIVVAHGASAEVRETATGRSLRDWNGAVINSAYFSPDGRRVVANFDDSYVVSIWDIEEDRSVFSESTGGRVLSSAMDSQGKWLVTAGKSGVQFFVLARPEPNRGVAVGNPGEAAWHVVLIDSNEFAVANDNGIVSIWRLPGLWLDDPAWQPQLKQLAVLQGHRGTVWHLAWHPIAGLLASGGDDGTVRLWRRHPPGIISDSKWEGLAALRRHDAKVFKVAFSSDGAHLASCGLHRDGRLWDTKPLQEGPTFTVSRSGFFDPTPQRGVDLLEFTADSRRLLTLVRGKVVRLWDAGTGRQVALLGTIESKDTWGFNTTESPSTTHAAFSSDGALIVTGHSDGTAALWDSTSGEKSRSLRGHAVALNYVQFDGDGRRVITAAGDGTVRIWDARTGRRVKNFGPLDSHPLTTALSPDGRLLAATHEDKSVSLWEINSRRLIARLGGPDQPALDPVFDRAEDTLCTAGDRDGSLRVWDCADGTLKRHENLDVARSHVYSAWSFQGRFFVTTDAEGEARVWDRTRPKRPTVLRGHTQAVTAVAIAPDAVTVVTGSGDGNARLWELASGQQLALYPGQGSGISAVTYTPDGKMIVTVAKDGSARIWYTRVNELTEEARRRLPQRPSPRNHNSATI